MSQAHSTTPVTTAHLLMCECLRCLAMRYDRQWSQYNYLPLASKPFLDWTMHTQTSCHVLVFPSQPHGVLHTTDRCPPGMKPSSIPPLQGCLSPLQHVSRSHIMGETTPTLSIKNKLCWWQQQLQQPLGQQFWSVHDGSQDHPPNHYDPIGPHCNKMCPLELTLSHPAAPVLLEYATWGCRVNTGKFWTQDMMQDGINCGPHKSVLAKDVIRQLHKEVTTKVACGQAKIVNWHNIKDDPPPGLKISPILMIPHKSQKYHNVLHCYRKYICSYS